jgi:hypothetical protein
MMKIGIGSTSGQIDPTVSAELVSRRWKEARLYYSLNRTARGVWPDGSMLRSASTSDVIKDIMFKETVDGEFATTGDVAEAALFFASFESNALTGAIARCEPRLVHAIAGAHWTPRATFRAVTKID